MDLFLDTSFIIPLIIKTDKTGTHFRQTLSGKFQPGLAQKISNTPPSPAQNPRADQPDLAQNFSIKPCLKNFRQTLLMFEEPCGFFSSSRSYDMSDAKS
jgi:hypothetical protein